MKRNLFIICFLYSICSNSQVNDSFSDKNFTENPTWNGNVDKFIVAPDYGMERAVYGLQLNDVAAGQAYLSTPSKLVRGTTWEFKLYFYGFKPTSRSFLKLYLTASNSNLFEELDGYYLMFGGVDRNISLMRQKGKELNTIIVGKKQSLDMNLFTLCVKVTCSKAGVWTLTSKFDDYEWSEEGHASDKSFRESNYAGIVCAYSKSSSSNLFVDDIHIYETESGKTDNDDQVKPNEPKEPDPSVDPNKPGDDKPHNPDSGTTPDKPDPNLPHNPDSGNDPKEPDPDLPSNPDISIPPSKPDPSDVNPPTMISVKLGNDRTVFIDFDEDVSVKRTNIGVWTGDFSVPLKFCVADNNHRRIIIMLSTPLTESRLYSLICRGVEDINGNRMNMFSELLCYEKGVETKIPFGTIVFSEIMANPNDVAGLPETEYLEIHNRTNEKISLKRTFLCSKSKRYPLPDFSIEPNQSLTLCAEKSIKLWQNSQIKAIGVPSFPSLINSGKLLWLEDAQGGLVSWIEYSDRWYTDNKKRTGGWALECVDVNNLSGDEANWKATIDNRGGTPSEKNSVSAPFLDEKAINVLSCTLETADTLVVTFSKPIDLVSLAEMSHYAIKSEKQTIKSIDFDYPCGRFVKLALDKAVSPAEVVKLEISGLIDISGNKQKEAILVEALQPEPIEMGDIMFNEILFDPFPEEVSYVELVNLSDKAILINQLALSNEEEVDINTRFVPLISSTQAFAPHSRLFFTQNKAKIVAHYNCDPLSGVEVNQFPKLSSREGVLTLFTRGGIIIDKMGYSESMHSTQNSNRKGISLEKKVESLSSIDPENWLSASFLSGYGTPGSPNRCNEQVQTGKEVTFWLEKSSFSPSNPENSRLQIAYSLPEEGYMATVQIFESSGRKVLELVNNQSLSAQGTFDWDGKEENGSQSRIGIYIAFIQVHNNFGEVKVIKLPFAVVG